MTTLRVSPEVREAIKRLKRSDESVDEYLQRKTQQDSDLKEGITTQSWLLDALDLIRKDVAAKTYYPEPSPTSIRMENYYRQLQEQDAKDMQDKLAKSNRDTEKRLYGDDEP